MPVFPKQDFRVVCLGGSAGALQAYIDILGNLPKNTGMAFVVAPHRGHDGASLLTQILANATAMPVVEVEDGMLLEPDRVYLMPPSKEMTVENDRFALQTSSKPTGWPITFSLFLFALAEAYGRRAVAVTLSGMDHDGSVALQAIKTAGGVTFAQSNPVFEDMPRHAVETGYVDFVLPPAAIARKLLDLPALSSEIIPKNATDV